MNAAPLYELFSSVQGEATRVGERHLFVRVAGCDLACAFCDTPASRRVPAQARMHLPDGVHEVDNPVGAETLDAWVERVDRDAGPHHAVALTGGEPLLFVDILAPLATRWRARGHAILLETGGHRPDDLARMLHAVDIVMADVKLLSSAGIATPADVTARFLQLAARRECAVKCVVSERTTAEEIDAVSGLVARHAPEATFVLQPVSGAAFHPPAPGHLLRLQRTAMRLHRATRVIPQTHRELHVR